MAELPRSDDQDHEKYNEFRQNLVEIVIWFAAVGAGLLLSLVPQKSPEHLVLSLLVAFFALLFPIVFRLVYDEFPFTYLQRQRILSRQKNNKNNNANVSDQGSPEDLLISYSVSSMKIAESLYSRSKVYLFIGAIIALAGVTFFYYRTQNQLAEKEFLENLTSLAPQFGILFFIEFVAFFFLRQYRTGMDDFRYFEAIQRRREELLVLIKLIKESNRKIDPMQLLKEQNFYSSTGKLATGETTEHLEARKLQKDEIELFGKLIEVVGKSKS